MVLGLGLLGLVACAEDDPKAPCLRPQPAFRVQVTAGARELPTDTELVVRYQGTVTERYGLAGPAADNEDVCCRPLAEPIDGPLPAVRCGEEPDAGRRDSGGAVEASRGDASLVSDASPDAGVPEAGNAQDAADAGSGARPDAAPTDAAPEAEAGRAGPRRPRAILCQMWTDGEAEIRITATGYDDVQRILDAKVEEARCGTETVDVRIELSAADAGR